MLRNRAVALLIGLALSPLVIALGLGPMQSSSFLNESFSGQIEILGVTPEDLDTLSVRLAPLEQFERAGIELNPVLYALRFEIDGDADVVRVTTRDPIREPYLNFLVEVNWAKGRLLREYTVLLDPPLYDSKRDVVGTAPAAVAPVAVAPVEQAPGPAPAPAPVRATAYAPGGEVGPMNQTDTLWSIAESYRPDGSVTVQQMMLALLRENPEAFGENNINLLRRGAILRLPDEAAIRDVSASEAFAEAQRHHQLWEAYRNEVSEAPAPQPVGAPAGGSEPLATETPESDARLELAAPEGEGDAAGGGTAAAGGSDELLHEEIEARTQQSEELERKLTEAEEIIDLLQRQVNIQDDELAALQARLAELGIDESEIDIPALREQAKAAAAAAAGEESITEEGEMTAEEPAGTGDEMAGETEPAVDETETMAAAEEAESAPVEEEPAATPEQTTAPATPPAERGFPDSLVPEQFAALVPGGAMTVLGAIAVVLVGLFAGIVAFLMRSRGDGEASEAAAAPVAAAAMDDEDDATEDPTITSATAVSDDGSEDATEVAAADEDFDPNATVENETDFDPNATVEAEAAAADAAVAGEEEEDPLEEVNVYLAYERFEQAEELVTRVIGEYPDRHEYKLRLLEVYYSSNDRAAYEAAARNLLDAVGEEDPLWDSAVAMWSEMSPDRALFAEGEAAPAAAPADEAASAFVDITGDEEVADAPGEDTVAHAPGADDGDIDFDLSSQDDDAAAADDGVLDLTASADDGDVLDVTAGDDDASAASGGDDEILDLTATTDDDVLDLTADTDDSGVVDLTAGGDAPAADEGGADILDVTSGGGDDGVLDITSGDDDGDLLDLSSGGDGGDLLDVTKTGDISAMDDADLLNVTSPGMADAEETLVVEADTDSEETSLDLDVAAELGAADGGEAAPDFDISETVATAFDESDAAGGEEVFDLTSADDASAAAEGDAGDGDLLDFDIGGLDDGGEDGAALSIDSEATTLVDGDGVDPVAEAAGGGELDFDLTMGEDELTTELQAEDSAAGLSVEESEDEEGRLEITMSSAGDDDIEGEISLQSEALDDLALDDTAGGPPALDDDFDIALEGTTEMDSIAADDTVDMASISASSDDSDASLDDLSNELDSALDDASLDELDLGGLEIEGEPELEIEIDDPALGGDALETVQLENTADLDIEDDDEKTVVMPVGDDVETQSDADEADTKLNLAKAYIELGDNEGARSILEEVVTSGDDAQKQEAQGLLDQLSG